MGTILFNYPPRKPLTEKEKREREAIRLLNKATKSIWWSMVKIRIVHMLTGLYVRMIYVIRALKKIRQPHLGDIVYYQGHRYWLTQGVNQPYWDLLEVKSDFQLYHNSVHETKFQMRPLWRRFFFSFRFTYRFYMGYWYQIDVMHKGKFVFK